MKSTSERDKLLITILGTKDPLSFGAVNQGVLPVGSESEVIDPSDEGEYNRYIEQHGEVREDEEDSYDYRRDLFT